MATEEPFVLSPELQSTTISALNAYLYQLRARTGRSNIYGDLIARVEVFRDDLFRHHYGVPLGGQRHGT